MLASLAIKHPDVIAFVGDIVKTSIEDSPGLCDFLSECVCTAPTVMTLGNHDYLLKKEDINKIELLGVKFLNDTWYAFNDELLLGGLTSAFYHKCEHYDPWSDMTIHPETEWLSDFAANGQYKVLLDHHPENYDQYTKQLNIDLILSGHNHGGQIRLFGKGIFARNQGLFPKFDGGIFEDRLIVSRGLANTMPIPRLFNPREIVFVDLIARVEEEIHEREA